MRNSDKVSFVCFTNGGSRTNGKTIASSDATISEQAYQDAIASAARRLRPASKAAKTVKKGK